MLNGDGTGEDGIESIRDKFSDEFIYKVVEGNGSEVCKGFWEITFRSEGHKSRFQGSTMCVKLPNKIFNEKK